MAAPEEGEELPNRNFHRSATQIWEDGANVGHQPTNPEDATYEELWERYAANTNFFGQVELAKDGGLSEADELIGFGRYFSSVMVILFVVLNIYFLISNSLRFLLPGESSQEDILLFTTRYIFPNTDVKGVQIIASVELLLVLYVLVRFSIQTWNILRPSNEMVQWYAVQELFWNVIPQASTISTLKFLNFVTPAVVLPDFLNLLGNLSGNTLVKLGRVFAFLGLRMLLALAGFDAVLFKMQTVRETALIYQSTEDWSEATTLLLTLFAFLNQLLGIVQLGWFVRKRIFAFIFAGEDGFMTEQEDALKETWESMLARRIWKDLPWYQALAAYLSYSDIDFQKLALETVEKKPAPQAPPAPQGSDVEMEQALAPNTEDY